MGTIGLKMGSEAMEGAETRECEVDWRDCRALVDSNHRATLA
jgi:hypothetical protein